MFILAWRFSVDLGHGNSHSANLISKVHCQHDDHDADACIDAAHSEWIHHAQLPDENSPIHALEVLASQVEEDVDGARKDCTTQVGTFEHLGEFALLRRALLRRALQDHLKILHLALDFLLGETATAETGQRFGGLFLAVPKEVPAW